ncbi:MAG: hypothetical protein U0269_32970 [Polyangiales bacterium]
MTDFDFYAMRWYGSTSADQRETCVRWYLEPTARLIFAAIPEANSVVLAVSQYWCDEAYDATHLSLLACPERNPKWPTLVKSAFFGGDTWERNAVTECIETVTGGAFGDSNYGNIVAFASQCRRDCHQEMTTEEAFRPWAVVRRAEGNDCATEIVGKTVQRAYEDNFNVGFSRINEDASADDDDYYDSAGARLDSFSKELVTARFKLGEAAIRLGDLETEVRQALMQTPADQLSAALNRLNEQYRAAIRAAQDAEIASIEAGR